MILKADLTFSFFWNLVLCSSLTQDRVKTVWNVDDATLVFLDRLQRFFTPLMAEEKPRKSLTGSSGRESFKTKNPFSRVKEEEKKRSNKGLLLMRKSWSTDSLASLNSSGSCVCAPTKHEGSFRCRLHRSTVTGHHGTGTASHGGLPPATTNR